MVAPSNSSVMDRVHGVVDSNRVAVLRVRTIRMNERCVQS